MDVEEQLNNGVRYIDIRLGILPKKYCNGESESLDKFRVIHEVKKVENNFARGGTILGQDIAHGFIKNKVWSHWKIADL